MATARNLGRENEAASAGGEMGVNCAMSASSTAVPYGMEIPSTPALASPPSLADIERDYFTKIDAYVGGRLKPEVVAKQELFEQLVGGRVQFALFPRVLVMFAQRMAMEEQCDPLATMITIISAFSAFMGPNVAVYDAPGMGTRPVSARLDSMPGFRVQVVVDLSGSCCLWLGAGVWPFLGSACNAFFQSEKQLPQVFHGPAQPTKVR